MEIFIRQFGIIGRQESSLDFYEHDKEFYATNALVWAYEHNETIVSY